MNRPSIKSAQQISQLFKLKGIKNIVITPGSRNAPLTIAFTEDEYFNCYSLVDERSAAFFAMGISQQNMQPTAVVGTSGSALLNYYPAVAEAYYSKIPLIVVSADRPLEWIDQSDGQTIRQSNALEKHTLKSVTLNKHDDADSLWYNSRLINEALNSAIEKRGPVHINVPFSEPLYSYSNSTNSDEKSFVKNIQIVQRRSQLEVAELEKYAQKWNSSTKKLILVGSNKIDKQLQIQLDRLSKDDSVLILTETTSNVFNDEFISNIDLLISDFNSKQRDEFAPEILLTVGQNIVSKRIKALLRSYSIEHWHIGDAVDSPDTYKNLTAVFDVDSDMFFSQLFFLHKDNKSDYKSKFLDIYTQKCKLRDQFMQNAGFSDLSIFAHISSNTDSYIQIQSANSSVVRYFQLFNLKNKNEFYCNRGTSGIEGSTSTAIGAAVANSKKTLLVSGDLSFLYDSNGLWNDYIPNNFKLIVINNSGGSIFKIIPGPSSTPAFDTYFRAKHQHTAKNIAEHFSFDYNVACTMDDFKVKFDEFLTNDNKPQLLEVDTSKVENEEILNQMWDYIKL
jgi:2-succinyl-5-enolpyruvyl-6-hydroxy-3-cyclohexene-1-carboxylate synthase